MERISVVITTFNRDQFLQETLLSVLNQDAGDFRLEIILVDDGSKTDYSSRIVQELNDDRLLLFKTVNQGLSAARNFGVKKSSGDWICFLDDDDVWAKDKIKRQIEVIKSNPEVHLVHGKCQVIDSDGKKTNVFIGASSNKAHLRSGFVFWNALGVWVVKAPTPIIKREVFDTIMFDESIKVGEDLDFYWRVFYFYKVDYIDDVLAYYREHSGGSSERLSKKKMNYVGVELKFYQNLSNLHNLSPYSQYKILLRLFHSAKIRFSGLNLPVPFYFDYLKYIAPLYCLSKISEAKTK